jgi:hypothetical protein
LTLRAFGFSPEAPLDFDAAILLVEVSAFTTGSGNSSGVAAFDFEAADLAGLFRAVGVERVVARGLDFVALLRFALLGIKKKKIYSFQDN